MFNAGTNSSGIVIDNGDSTYNVTYRCPVAGAYSLNIYMNNTQVVASAPYPITVFPAVPYANLTRVTSPSANLMASGVAVALQTTVVTMYDQFNNSHSVGGNRLIVKCTNNYGFYPTVIRGSVVDGGNGAYTITWTPTTAATMWQCFVLVVDGQNFNQPNGLLANYYNNRWLQAPAVVTRVDPFFNFQWGTDLITPTAANYVSAQYTGYILGQNANAYTFYLNADDSVRLYVDNALIIDTWKLSAPGEVSGTYTFPTAGLLYDIVIQYRQNTGQAFLNFSWWCQTCAPVIARALVPNSVLFSGATNIMNSPFIVNTN